MNRTRFVLVGLALGMVLLGAVLTALVMRAVDGGDSTSTNPATSLVQRRSGGGIDAVATLATASNLDALDKPQAEVADLGKEVAIILTLDTHQGDLRKFDYLANTRLRAEDGSEQAPTRWVPVSDDSHHYEGVLVFVRQPGARTTLAVRGLGGVQEWLFDFPSQP